ncbi:MAG: sulfite exporter TauE/SafE family protein [Ardenticatenaceae bacterium]|nr:sulfite exporter TauE/SafE family protein [Anaerolineales bacterium]MCB8920175.1 sulfite exporter TauE/SafE family protein [Ardenticatenaceae bacterium]
MDVNTSLLTTLLVTGFLGSLGHCLGMCGPLVMMVGLQLKKRGQNPLPFHLLYHTSRLVVYAVLGAVIGALGSLLGLSGQLTSAAGVVSLVLGTAVILLGAGYLGWLPWGKLESNGRWISQAMSRVLKRGGVGGIILLGALNGLLPCGLVYSALLVTAASGGPLPGALGMFLFGAGTIPALLVVGIGAGALSLRMRQAMARVAGVAIIVVGVQLALRGLAALHLIAHQQLGGIVLW